LISSSSNDLFSPYSISLALAMTYAGARGQTEKQMVDTLHFSLAPDQLHPAFNALDLALASRAKTAGQGSSADQGFELNIANSIWGQAGFPFEQAYLDLLAQNYGAGLRLADFQQDPEASRNLINQWVSEATKDKIKDLFPQGSIDANTRLALANAIYFKAAWESPFTKESTSDKTFHLADGSAVDVPMMYQGNAHLEYAKEAGYQAVGLPYVGDQVKMVAVMPDEGKFQAFESGLTAAQLNGIFQSLQGQTIDLSMPKFKFETEFDLGKTLTTLGMANAFNPDQADFSGMDGRKDLYISAVLHKAYIAVDENGTEAAAATGVAIGVTAIQANIPQVTLDRPFLFFIIDQETGTVLFAGKVMNPKES
ncbi:MAG: serpin family protein, partial [Omnitrophica WOR_2 bacterium]